MVRALALLALSLFTACRCGAALPRADEAGPRLEGGAPSSDAGEPDGSTTEESPATKSPGAEVLLSIAKRGSVTGVLWLDGGKLVASETLEGVTVSSAADGAARAFFPRKQLAGRSADGSRFALHAARQGDGNVIGLYDGHRLSPIVELGEPIAPQRHRVRAALSADGASVARSRDDGRVEILRAGTSTKTRTLSGNGEPILALAWSPDSRSLATASSTVQIWNVATGESRTLLEGDDLYPSWLAWSPEGDRLVVAALDSPVSILDATDGRVLQRLEGQGGDSALGISFARDGLSAWTAEGGGTLRRWDLRKGRSTAARRVTGDFIRCLDHSAEAGLVIGGEGGHVAAIDLDDGSSRTILGDLSHHSFLDVALSADGRTFATIGGCRGGAIWSVADLAEPRFVTASWDQDNEGLVAALCGDQAAFGCLSGEVLPWDRESGLGASVDIGLIGASWCHEGALGLAGTDIDDPGEIRLLLGGHPLQLAGPEGRVEALAAAPSELLLASAHHERGLVLWSLADGSELDRWGDGGEVTALAFTADGGQLLSGDRDGRVSLREVSTGRVRPLAPATGDDRRGTYRRQDGAMVIDHDEVISIAVDPGGEVVAAGRRSGALSLWSLKTLSHLTTVRANQAEVTRLAWSRDGEVLAAVSYADSARLYRRRGAELLREGEPLPLVHNIAWSSDGAVLVAASRQGLRFVRHRDGASLTVVLLASEGARDHLAITYGEGLFDAPEAAWPAITVRVGERTLSLSVEADRAEVEAFRRPGLLQALLEGRPLRR